MVETAKRSYHRIRMRARRLVRRQRRQVEDITVQADDSLDKHFFRRVGRLKKVRRFVGAWVLLVLFIGFGAIWQVRSLDRFYLDLLPVEGGVYREGMIGNFTTANPLFATGSADVAVSELVFSGLFKLAPDGTLQPDLATGYSVDEDGAVYTVTLRENVRWHDGETFDSSDVLFTYETIKNPEVKSPLKSGWASVSVSAPNQTTVVFTLPNSLSAFPYSLTNGIVPEHLLSKVALENLRSDAFNTVRPVGTGSFRYSSVEVLGESLDDRQEKVTLERNDDYYFEPAKIEGVSVLTFRSEDQLTTAFKDKEISAMVGLQSLADDIAADETVQSFSTPLSSQVMIFFNNDSQFLNDKSVRKALALGTNTDELRAKIPYQLISSDSPFLRSHFAYDATKVQLGYDLAAANTLLDELGWVRNQEGIREKDGQKFNVRLISQSLTEYATIVRGLQEQWTGLGVKVEALLQPEEDIQSGAIIRQDYDILLYGISLGPDPDVFAYWHSSQNDPRVRSKLNLSRYSSAGADLALEAGRTRTDQQLRKLKYAPFLDAWREDVPAVALYQPRFLFVVRGTFEGYRSGQFLSAGDRFYSITDWKIRKEKTIKDPES